MLDKVKKVLNEMGYETYVTDVSKGGVFKKGLVVGRKGDVIRPTFYIEDMEKSGWGIEKILDNIYFHLKENNTPSFLGDVSRFSDFCSVSDKIIPCVRPIISDGCVSYKINDEMEMIFRVVFPFSETETESEGEYSFRVTQNLLKVWDIPCEVLKELASENIEKKYTLISMEKLMGEYIFGIEVDEQKDSFNIESKGDNLFVARTPKIYGGQWGASAIGSEVFLDKVCKFLERERIAILPSSVHEILICNFDIDTNTNGLTQMVREGNKQIEDESIKLSDFAYIYDSRTKTLSKVA